MWEFRVFKDKNGKWRWRLVAANKKIVADSAEGYATKGSVVRAVRRFMRQISGAEFEVVEYL